jgi:hypothetical protein
LRSMWRRRESRENTVASAKRAPRSPPCRISVLHLSGPGRGPRACGIVGDLAGLSPGAPHRAGGLPVSEPGLDADTQCRS